jgi:hypothetical protein
VAISSLFQEPLGILQGRIVGDNTWEDVGDCSRVGEYVELREAAYVAVSVEVFSFVVVAVIINVVIGVGSIIAPQACMQKLAEPIIAAIRAMEIVFIGPPLRINLGKLDIFELYAQRSALSRVDGCAGLGSLYLLLHRRANQRRHQAEVTSAAAPGWANIYPFNTFIIPQIIIIMEIITKNSSGIIL